jgi:hypothetical protein
MIETRKANTRRAGSRTTQIEVVWQPGARQATLPYVTLPYESPQLLHVGDEIDALLAVRLDPTR